jgi:serine/threonine protein kinase
MQSLVGVHIKNEREETENGQVLYPFMLIFPNKRRIYYLKSEEEKQFWLEAIKKVIGYADLYDFYEFGDVLGQGKYGLVKKGIHKKTKKEVAIKIVKKKELNLKDKEMLKRETEVLKVC